ncbi:MAG: hypothetical protein H6738_17835 [Alphaproteobacteria bacterium]|nr:hypothetical protein [Alphaproteobacteria bacterium]MCB9698647.1 hypothetical protein [Alphaproteobacteria bacterium]
MDCFVAYTHLSTDELVAVVSTIEGAVVVAPREDAAALRKASISVQGSFSEHIALGEAAAGVLAVPGRCVVLAARSEEDWSVGVTPGRDPATGEVVASGPAPSGWTLESPPAPPPPPPPPLPPPVYVDHARELRSARRVGYVGVAIDAVSVLGWLPLLIVAPRIPNDNGWPAGTAGSGMLIGWVVGTTMVLGGSLGAVDHARAQGFPVSRTPTLVGFGAFAAAPVVSFPMMLSSERGVGVTGGALGLGLELGAFGVGLSQLATVGPRASAGLSVTVLPTPDGLRIAGRF